MPTDLILPTGTKPSNLHLPPEVQHMSVEGDVYGICERIKEIDPNLHVVLIVDGDDARYVIMEHCNDGVERMVFKTKQLDGRVEKKLRYIMSVPLAVRIANLEKENAKFEEEARENEFEELYENLGRPMWTQLEHDGFIDGRGSSYAKRGITK